MQFRNLAENLLGSKVKVKLVRYLLLEEAITSEREIAKLIGVSHAAVNKALKELHEQNLVVPLRVGNSMVWQLNKQSYAYQLLQSFPLLLKQTPISRLIIQIKASLGHLKYVKKSVIYGSIALSTELPNSDIDLFVLVESEKDRKDVIPSLSSLNESCMRMFGNGLSANVFTVKDLTEPRNKKFLENVNKGIMVFEK